MTDNTQNTMILPVLPLRGVVVFPKMITHFDVGRKESIKSLTFAMDNNQMIFLSSQLDPSKNEVTIDDIYKVGTVCKIVQVLKNGENTTRIVVEGQYRAKIDEEYSSGACMQATVEPIKIKNRPHTARELALIRSLKSTFERYMELSPKISPEILFKIGLSSDAGDITDYVASNVSLDVEIKQLLLETTNVVERMELLIDALQNEIFLLDIEQEILDKAKDKIDKAQRDYFLREQIRTIEEELGEDDQLHTSNKDFRNKIEEMQLSEQVKEVLLKECSRLEKLPFGSQEASVIENYLELCLELPWNEKTKVNIDLDKVKEKLDKDHYGLDKVKKRIIEQLAVQKLSSSSKSQIICLVGPPGVGKTSIAMSIADAIGRKSARVSLGGVKDEAEIRGHRRTYIAAMPGRIINAFRQCKVNNPLIILDEIDKLSNDYKGDPTSALLEVLDGEQNNAFVDHYIDLPFDLSDAMFITTANDIDSIPDPLRDRMDVIELSSYTRYEKFNIAKKHLLPKQLKRCGIMRKNFRITDKAIYILIDSYTKEAGVRNLERMIQSLLRKAAVKILSDENVIVRLNDKNIEEYLGPLKYIDDINIKKNEIGTVNGLAWTSVGGTLLPIECAVVKGSGKIELTGSLGDVMQESAKAAVTYIRAKADKFGIDTDFYEKYDIHIHALEGAIPKDGPSAGVTMATAIYSALTSNPVRHDFAMTGEISIRGKVLPIGGLKEKVMAAYKSKIKNIIIPKDNVRDIQEIDEKIREEISFYPVYNVDEVISLAIVQSQKGIKASTKPLLYDVKSSSNNISATL